VLITIDTLRVDHISCYGYERNTTPFLDKLADKGTLFRKAYATSPWTLPSMASIFTGLYPRTHGLHRVTFIHNEERTITTWGTTTHQFFSPELVTLAEALQKNGYRTFGISCNPHLSEEVGFARGFDHFGSYWFLNGRFINHKVGEWKSKLADSEPYFLWLHYFDPHDPYKAHEPWILEYNSDERQYRKWSKESYSMFGREEDVAARPDLLETLVDLYDSEINYTDSLIRVVLEELLPPDPNRMIIVTSDHGEGFLDHELVGHGNSLFEELIRVPLIIVPPEDKVVTPFADQPVTINDIFPTICEAVGQEAPSGLHGRSLFPLMEVAKEAGWDGEREILSEVRREDITDGYQEVLIKGKWKYNIRRKGEEERPELFLFDLVNDPGERINRIETDPEVASEMDMALNDWLHAHPLFEAPMAEQAMSREQMEQLKSLGYLEEN
jgi:arylsulfatase A-like enzyme